jgi:hypothetical protein
MSTACSRTARTAPVQTRVCGTSGVDPGVPPGGARDPGVAGCVEAPRALAWVGAR